MRHEGAFSRIMSAIFGNKVAVRENLFYDTMKGSLDFAPDDIPNVRAVLAYISGGGLEPISIPQTTTTTPKVIAYSATISPDYVLINLTGSPTNLIDNSTNVTYDGANFTIYGLDDGTGHFSDSFTFAIKP